MEETLHPSMQRKTGPTFPTDRITHGPLQHILSVINKWPIFLFFPSPPSSGHESHSSVPDTQWFFHTSYTAVQQAKHSCKFLQKRKHSSLGPNPHLSNANIDRGKKSDKDTCETKDDIWNIC